jgi:hypothetical protein
MHAIQCGGDSDLTFPHVLGAMLSLGWGSRNRTSGGNIDQNLTLQVGSCSITGQTATGVST